jgi:hypothetical protein
MLNFRPSFARFILLGATLAWNQPLAFGAEDELSLGITAGYSTRAVYRGVERTASAWQTALEGDVGPWRGAIWSTRSFDSAAPDELSSALGYVWKLGGAFTLEAWGTHFWYVDQPVVGAPAHSFEADLQLTWASRNGWRLGLMTGHDIRVRADSIQGSIDYDLMLSSWGTFLQLRAFAGYVTAKDLLPDASFPRLGDDYAYGGVDLRLPYHFSYHSSVAVEAHHVLTHNQAEAWSPLGVGSGTRQWVNVSYRYDF